MDEKDEALKIVDPNRVPHECAVRDDHLPSIRRRRWRHYIANNPPKHPVAIPGFGFAECIGGSIKSSFVPSS